MRRKCLGLLAFLCMVLVISACSSEQSKTNQENSAKPAESIPAQDAKWGYSKYQKDAASLEGEQVQRKIIKQASLTQKVTELEPALKQVQHMVDQSGGYIQSSTINEVYDKVREATYVLRVPQASFGSIVEALQGIGKNTHISQKGDDVTLEYYDNEARIKNLQLQEEAVQKLLSQAKKMEDILQIQQELFRIRGEIEALQGKNRFLDHHSALSTIELTIREVKPVEMTADSPWQQAKAGFLDSLSGVYHSFIHLFVFLISYLPVILFIYLPFGIVIWYVIRRRRKNKERSVNQNQF